MRRYREDPGILISCLLQNLPSVIWKALGLSMSNHQNLQVLSLAGSGIGDATLQVRILSC